MTIFLVRHGETEWNLQRRYQGRFDSPLTERGIAQARAIGGLLSGLPELASAAIVASPQGRARRTAEIIAGCFESKRAVRLDERLCELSVGGWDGLTYAEIAARSPGVFNGEGRHEWYFRAPGAEGCAAFGDRLREWLSEALGGTPLLVVTHGLVTRVLRGLYAGLPRRTALTLPVPQDRAFRLAGGIVEEIPG